MSHLSSSDDDEFVVLPDESEKIKRIITKLLHTKNILNDKIDEIDSFKKSYQSLVNSAIETCLKSLNRNDLRELQINDSFIDEVLIPGCEAEHSTTSLMNYIDSLKTENNILKNRIRIYDDTINNLSEVFNTPFETESSSRSLEEKFSNSVSILERYHELIQQDFNRQQNSARDQPIVNDSQQLDDMRPSVSELIDQKIKSSIDKQMDVVKAYFETILAKIDIPPNKMDEKKINEGKRVPTLTTLPAHCISMGGETLEEKNLPHSADTNNYEESSSSYHRNENNAYQKNVDSPQRHSTQQSNQSSQQLEEHMREECNPNSADMDGKMPKCEPPTYDTHMRKNPDLSTLNNDDNEETPNSPRRLNEDVPSYTFADEIPICPNCGRAFDSRDLLELHLNDCLD